MKKASGLMAVSAALLLAHGAALAAVARTVYRATLTGSEEAPARVTPGTGIATFAVSKDGNEINYRLVVNNLQNVTEAHIHLGARGENGPAVAHLFGPAAPGKGKKNGILAAGTLRASDLMGPLAGKSIADLVAEMRAGHAYVNVHTNDGIGEANRGPGDYPEGEIRGQIR